MVIICLRKESVVILVFWRVRKDDYKCGFKVCFYYIVRYWVGGKGERDGGIKGRKRKG